jgi:hypothetical protein
MKEISLEIETDKAMEFESFDEGTLLYMEFRRRNSTCRLPIAIIGRR